MALTAACSREIASVNAQEEQNETNQPEVNVPLRQVAITVGDTETKTQLADGNAVYWTADDAIDVYVNGTKYTLTNSNTEAAANATFTGELPEGELTVYAIYPSGSASACADGVFTATIPTEQDAVTAFETGTDLSSNVSVATGTVAEDGTGSLYFLNTCSILKFKVGAVSSTGQSLSNVSSVVIRGANGEFLSGESSVDATNAVEGGDVTTTAKTTYVKVNAPEGGFSADATYYVWAAPVNMESGFTVEYEYKKDDVEIPMMVYNTTTAKDFKRASIVDLGDVTATEGCYLFTLVDAAGSYATFATDGNYAIAYPDPSDDTQYDLFSFDKYINNAAASAAMDSIKAVTSSSTTNARIIKRNLFSALRKDAIVKDYESSSLYGSTNYYLGVPVKAAGEVSFATASGTQSSVSGSTDLSNTIDKSSSIKGTFKTTVSSTSYSVEMYNMTLTSNDDNTVILGAIPNPTNVLALYKGLRGGNYANISWDDFIDSQNFDQSGSSWSYLKGTLGTMVSQYKFSKGTCYYNSNDVAYNQCEAVLVSNMIFDKVKGSGFIPVIAVDIQALGVHEKAASSLAKLFGKATWGSSQMRTANNHFNAVIRNTVTNGVSIDEVNNGSWCNPVFEGNTASADDKTYTTLQGVTYTGANTTHRYPLYTYTNAAKVYVYKNTGKYVGVE